MNHTTDLLERAISALNAGYKGKPTLRHATDVSKAKELFQALHAEGIPLSLPAVLQIAISHGWEHSDATELAQLAERIGLGGRVVIPHRTGWGKRTVAKIKSEIANSHTQEKACDISRVEQL